MRAATQVRLVPFCLPITVNMARRAIPTTISKNIFGSVFILAKFTVHLSFMFAEITHIIKEIS